MIIKENILLAPYTTFNIGGRARYFCCVKNIFDLEKAVEFANTRDLPLFVLGGGSNLLIADQGFQGVVIKIEIKGITFEKKENGVMVTAYAGEVWDDLVGVSVARGYYGIENLTGVPGTVGGAPIQNIGCYGVSFSHVVESIHVYNTETKKHEVLSREECCFGYRTSIFKRPEGQKYIVTHIVVYLQTQGTLVCDYHDVKRFFETMSVYTPTLHDIREALLTIRERKGMLYMDGYERYHSAGSFFKAPPFVTRDSLERIRAIVMHENQKKARALEPWYWEQENGLYKIAPAFLMEFTPYNRTDFLNKTFRNTVGISPKHTLALINYNHACADDVTTFAQEIQVTVYKKFGVLLEPEVCLLGVQL